MREVTVRCRWESVHTFEVEDDTEQYGPNDLERLMDETQEDVFSNTAELVDWEVTDRGPVAA